MHPLNEYFDQFFRERIYLHNITPKTREWYQNVWVVFARWRSTLPPRDAMQPIITHGDLQNFVVALRERGVKPVSCNCYMRGINAFCGWLHQQGTIPAPIRIAPQRLEKRLLPTHDERALRVTVLYELVAFGQIQLRKIVGHTKLPSFLEKEWKKVA